MVTVIKAERRSSVLTPSNLACLSRMPTINLTAGCALGCVYCYTLGYASYPGEDKIVVYVNTLERLSDELARKQTRPRAVYFSPSCDLFQPVPEVLKLGHQVLEFLLSEGIGVAFLTKGRIPDNTLNLLWKHAGMVRAQVGITTLNEDVAGLFEPSAERPSVRLEQIARLIAGGIATEARLDPVLPGLTDSPASLDCLFSALAGVGVSRAATSVLFLRPRIQASLKQNVRNEPVLQELLSFYHDARRLAIRAEHSFITTLPHAARTEIYKRIGLMAKQHSIVLSVCACKNPDLARGTCNIAGGWPRRSRHGRQMALFGKGN